MNWMTSGRHRALYSQRGRRRQMHFPSQVQRERVKSTSPRRKSSQAARNCELETPWYILPVGDDEESHDIRVLELERKGAMRIAEVVADERNRGTESATFDRANDGRTRSIPTYKKQGGEGAGVEDEKRDKRCIFTPVKKARKYDHLSDAVPQQRRSHPSSISSGVDIRFFK
ncbi:hypothetical protein PsorP6_010287 [Peronosclerospora sorghi]|uniref:Uncharacterized protein n=1 Tax=Peronosclerospora sorghi TaxID=230839 RepID=A0ACC0VVE2_9STRA|nr:hypothetical protein PsorP6_010287 [Peronosclerospora sorghi]